MDTDTYIHFNPNKSGMLTYQRRGLLEVFLQLLLYPPPPPLKLACRTGWRKNSNWFKPRLWYCFCTKQYQRMKKPAAVARFYFGFLPFLDRKWSYFEVLINFKKNSLFLYKTVSKQEKTRCSGPVFFGFSPFSHWKWSYFEVLIN